MKKLSQLRKVIISTFVPAKYIYIALRKKTKFN